VDFEATAELLARHRLRVEDVEPVAEGEELLR
jgi:hypothetical protein